MPYVERQPVTTVVHEDEHTYGAVIARRVILYLLDVLEVLLAFRFFLRLLAANPASPFVQFIYALTQPLVYPFTGIFPPIASQGSVLEWATLLAMVVYAIIAWGIVRLIWILSAHKEPLETDTVVEEREDVHYHDDDTMV
jgi:uncharacterized protein YggT (Ycf19 family)